MVICTFVIQRWQVRWQAETPHGYPHLCYPETIESDSMRRHLMIICTFVIQRRQVRWHAETPHGHPHLCHLETASPMTRRDKYGHLFPLSKTWCISTETILVSPLLTRGKQARWHAETDTIICISCRRLSVYRPGLLYLPLLPSRDNQVWWLAKTITVTCFCCSKTIKVPFII